MHSVTGSQLRPDYSEPSVRPCPGYTPVPLSAYADGEIPITLEGGREPRVYRRWHTVDSDPRYHVEDASLHVRTRECGSVEHAIRAWNAMAAAP